MPADAVPRSGNPKWVLAGCRVEAPLSEAFVSHLAIGVMSGVQAAESAVAKISASLATRAVKQLPRTPLTKGAIYPIVKSVARVLGIQMTKEIFANGVRKVIPFVGGVASGALSYVIFRPMTTRLLKHLDRTCFASATG